MTTFIIAIAKNLYHDEPATAIFRSGSGGFFH